MCDYLLLYEIIKSVHLPSNPYTVSLTSKFQGKRARQRNVLNDAEWRSYAQWMRNCFKRGTISERWKQIEEDRWFDPAFQKFINVEIVGTKPR
jgi:hypothetical protein